MKPVPVELTK